MELTDVAAPEHARVVRVAAQDLGLIGFIAIHSTALGPAAGGLRMRAYDSEAAALEDVLRLSRGMTFKNAAAGLPLGGGKAVILGDPKTQKTPAMLAAFGRAIDSLGGQYWTAEDMGMTPADMAAVARGTDYVAGLETGAFASGDPSPITARGIFNAIRTTARHAFGSDDLAGTRIAVQGLGHVGRGLSRLLCDAGAWLTVADVDEAAARAVAGETGAAMVAPAAILAAEVDILAPCAIGAVLNADTIPGIAARAVAGGANNQLAHPEDADRLAARGILYAPDFVVNGGGIINVATEILQVPDRDRFVAEKLVTLDRTLDAILTRARAADTSPHHVAEAVVAERMQAAAA
ncbi:MAG: Glu/Leu/Phe/Val dehydrogenase dimerization domain-containing protein [Pseudomonadota bacterium]